MSNHCAYLQELLKRTDEGSMAQAIDHVMDLEYSIDDGGSWKVDGEAASTLVLFGDVEQHMYELYGYSSVERVEKVMQILQGLHLASYY